MSSQEMLVSVSVLAHDDTGGSDRPVVLLPGAGDLRSEHRFLATRLSERGHRVVTADLPGHGASPTADSYTVAAAAESIIRLLETLGGGPAVLVACSFSPAAAVWAAAERPDVIAGLVAVSPHLHEDDSFKGRALGWAVKAMLAGPWAGAMWAKAYSGWYKTAPPADLAVEVDKMKVMLADPARRRAVRETLTAHRRGMAERIAALALPTLTVFGSLDDHFPDPVAEAAAVATELGGDQLVVEGAGHYPHVESPDAVAAAVDAFIANLA